MGATWKMPTYEQCQELIDNTTSTWTTINGVNGRKFTSKTDSSKYIFLPASGSWSTTYFSGSGSSSSYWITTGSPSQAGAMYSGSDNLYISVIYSRWPGCSVRAIQTYSLNHQQ